MKTIKLIVEIVSEFDFPIEAEIDTLRYIIGKYYENTKIYEYTEPVEELKPNRP